MSCLIDILGLVEIFLRFVKLLDRKLKFSSLVQSSNLYQIVEYLSINIFDICVYLLLEEDTLFGYSSSFLLDFVSRVQ